MTLAGADLDDVFAAAAAQVAGTRPPPRRCVVAIYLQGPIVAYPAAYTAQDAALTAARRLQRREPAAAHYIAYGTASRLYLQDLAGTTVAAADRDGTPIPTPPQQRTQHGPRPADPVAVDDPDHVDEATSAARLTPQPDAAAPHRTRRRRWARSNA